MMPNGVMHSLLVSVFYVLVQSHSQRWNVVFAIRIGFG
jgi:hypothetical protein